MIDDLAGGHVHLKKEKDAQLFGWCWHRMDWASVAIINANGSWQWHTFATAVGFSFLLTAADRLDSCQGKVCDMVGEPLDQSLVERFAQHVF